MGGIDSSGYEVFGNEGTLVHRCSQCLGGGYELVVGEAGSGIDGLREAARRAKGESPWREIAGKVLASDGSPVADALVHVEDATGQFRTGSRADGWQQVAGAGRQLTAERLRNPRRPFKDTGNQKSSLIECALHSAMGASQRGFRRRAVVAAIEHQRVVPQTCVLQVLSQPADRATHGCDFRIAFTHDLALG